MDSVDATSAPVDVEVVGLNVPDAPLGNPVMLKSIVQELAFPLKAVVMVNCVEAPACTGLGFCAPIVTVFGFESLNIV
jgi:hypothetical protein